MNVLIIDDEDLIRDVVKEYCLNENYKVFEASNGIEGLDILENEDIDIIVLDIMMPKMDGYTFFSKMKEKYNIPTIVLSARGEEYDKLFGFSVGIDDYLTKPFSPRELIARIKANLRKHVLPESNSSKKGNEKIYIKDMIIDPEKYIAIIGDKKIDLTPKEFELLKMLSSEPTQVYTREQILKGVWGYDFYGDARTVDVTIRRLREKIEKNPAEPQYVQTKRGMGYYISD